MAKTKEKKVEARDVLRNELAQLIMANRGLNEIGRTKEGLLVQEGENDLIVRVVQKKDKVEKNAIVETIQREE